jgi:hypothetical protein
VRFPVFARSALLGVAAVVFVLRDHSQPDSWWALRAGQDMWHSHHILMTETWSYTAQGAYWPNHEWLWQVLAYGTYAVGGLALVTLLNAAAALAAVALARPDGAAQRADAAALAFFMVPVMLTMAVRPQALSLLLFVITLRLVLRERWWPLPLITLVWANLHGGVVIGVAVIGAGAAVAVVRGVLAHEHRRMRPAIAALLASAAATLATPMGVHLWTFIPASVAQAKRDGVAEWASMLSLEPVPLVFWAVVASIALLAVVRRDRLTSWALQVAALTAAGCAAETAISRRNLPFFALAAMVLVIGLLRNDRTRANDAVPRGRTIIGLWFAGAAAVTIGMVAAPVAALGTHPIRSAAVAAIESCPGHVYTTYDSSGTLEWFAPRVPVFVDSREYPFSQQVIDLGLLGSPKRSTDYASIFRRYDIRCAAFPGDEEVVRTFLGRQGWRTAYDDGAWIVMTDPSSRLISPS